MKKYKDMTAQKLANTLNQIASAYKIIDGNSETAIILEEAAYRVSLLDKANRIWPVQNIKDEA